MTGKGTRLDVTSSARLWQCQSTRMGTGGGGALPLASSGRSWKAGCSYQVVAALDVEAPSGRTCVRPAVNPAPAGYEPAAVRMDVCAPGSEPSPCRLRNSRRPDGRVCARQ